MKKSVLEEARVLLNEASDIKEAIRLLNRNNSILKMNVEGESCFSHGKETHEKVELKPEYVLDRESVKSNLQVGYDGVMRTVDTLLIKYYQDIDENLRMAERKVKDVNTLSRGTPVMVLNIVNNTRYYGSVLKLENGKIVFLDNSCFSIGDIGRVWDIYHIGL